MPFIGFLGPTWKPVILTRILHRQDVYYHRIIEYTSIFSYFAYSFIFGKTLHRRIHSGAVAQICKNQSSTISLWVTTISISFSSSGVKNRSSLDSALMAISGSFSNAS